MNVVVGWYGQGNCGDDAFVHAFRELFPGRKFRFVCGGRDLDLAGNEQVILGGGDVVKPYYLDFIPKSNPLKLIGCGLGYESEIDLLKEHNVELAVLRNQSDVDLASKKDINSTYAPDICFAIPEQRPAEIPPGIKSKKLGVILSAHAEPGVGQTSIKGASYFEFMKWELASFLDDICQYYDIHWISFSSDTDHYDETAHYSVRKKMIRRRNQTFWPYQADEPLRQISLVASMDAIITMKFHGAIFAMLQGVPFVSVGFTRKLYELCNAANLSQVCVRPYEFTFSNAMTALKHAEMAGTKERLLAISAKNKQLLLKTFNSSGEIVSDL